MKTKGSPGKLVTITLKLESILPSAIIVAAKAVARVLFADFVNSYTSVTEDHGLLCRNCDSEGSLEKLCKGKIVELAAIRKQRE